MIKIICGEKGKGKTKEMLSQANDSVQHADGSIVYIDKSTQHIYELNNKIRLIDMTEYPVNTYDGFIGFICGLLAGNHDIEKVYIDSVLKLSKLTADEIEKAVEELDKISEDVEFVVSVSANKDDLSDSVQEKIFISC